MNDWYRTTTAQASDNAALAGGGNCRRASALTSNLPPSFVSSSASASQLMLMLMLMLMDSPLYTRLAQMHSWPQSSTMTARVAHRCCCTIDGGCPPDRLTSNHERRTGRGRKHIPTTAAAGPSQQNAMNSTANPATSTRNNLQYVRCT